MSDKRLYRSEENRIFAGIIGGLGEYLDVDAVFLRVIWVLIVVFTGFVPGIIAYIIAIFIIPQRPSGRVVYEEMEKKNNQ